jgi:hypothetical protein
VVAAIELTTHAATTTARPQQQEGAAAVAALMLATCDPHQGRERACAESCDARGRGAAVTSAGGDSTSRGGRLGVVVGPAPGPEPEVLVVRSDGCVMSQQPTPNAGALTSRVAASAPDAAPS